MLPFFFSFNGNLPIHDWHHKNNISDKFNSVILSKKKIPFLIEWDFFFLT